MKEILRRTWAEIDLDALAVRQAANPNAKVCCVVKADAYGHGAVRMAQEFEALGADWFAVSIWKRPCSCGWGAFPSPCWCWAIPRRRRRRPLQSTPFPSACTAWTTRRSSPTV